MGCKGRPAWSIGVIVLGDGATRQVAPTPYVVFNAML